MDCFAALAMTVWRERARQINPTRNSIPIYGNRVKPLNKKYFAFSEVEIKLYELHPVPLRGASAIVTNEGRVAVDAGRADKRTARERAAKSCGPDAPMLASTVATVQGSPGRARSKP